MSTISIDRRGAAPQIGLSRFVLVTVAMAVAGAALVAPVVLGNDEPAHPDPVAAPQPIRGAASEVDAVVPTSFGLVAVEFVEMIPALSARDLSGMTHGIQGLVPAGQELVQVSATITNSSDAPIAYAPTQFAIRLEDGTRVPPSGTAAVPGVLQPEASIDLRVDFVVPGDGGNVWLVYLDGARAVEVDLGPTLVADDEEGHDDAH